MADIFISYASQDREIARQLAERLGEAGYAVCWDRTIPPGRVFDEVIQEALASARSVTRTRHRHIYEWRLLGALN